MTETQNNWQKVEWQPVVDGRTQNVPILCLVSSEAMLPGADPVFVFPGFGEEKRATSTAIRTLEDNEIPSIGVVLPFSFTMDKVSLERSIREAPVAATQWFNEMANKPTDSPVDVIGKSQGGGVSLVAGLEAPELFGALGLISPVGITNEFMGKTPNAKILNFILRLAVLNNLEPEQNPLRDPGNLVAFYEVAMRVAKDISTGNLKRKLDIAFGLDLAKNVRELSKDHPMRLFLATGDKLFRTEEYKASLGEDLYRLVVEEIDGSHSPITNKAGRNQIVKAGNWVKAVRSDRDHKAA